MCEHVTFVDVDYPQLMEKKKESILASSLLRDFIVSANPRISEPPVFLRNERYLAVGCDLRDLSTLEQTLKREIDIAKQSVLFIGEVSITYMKLDDANTLIKWASGYGDARFCVLEQYLPDGPEHPFAQTMLKHFVKLQTPLQSISMYPQLRDQRHRFIRAGWPGVQVRNLWELWTDSQYISPDLRQRLDSIEPFDEWEEFALFAAHYFVLVGRNTPKDYDYSDWPTVDDDTFPEADQAWRCIPLAWESPEVELGPIGLSHEPPVKNASGGRRRFGATFKLGPTVNFHGGLGAQARLKSSESYATVASANGTPGPPTAQAYMCHTITAINEFDALMVGGRTSPNHANPECWLWKNQLWKQVGDLQPARFRHCAIQVRIPRQAGDSESVLVFGGKTSSGIVLDEWRLWDPDQGWQLVSVIGLGPPARFGASMATIANSLTNGVLCGGMTSDGRIISDFWEWELRFGKILEVVCKNRTQDITPNTAHSSYARFGANIVPFGQDILLIGGVRDGHIIGAKEEFLTIKIKHKIEIERLDVLSPSSPRPLLVGFGAANTSDREVLLIGGGAVCFSMGSFWNSEPLSIRKKDSGCYRTWHLLNQDDPEGLRPPVPRSLPNMNENTSPKQSINRSNLADRNRAGVKSVRRVRIQSAIDFLDIVATSEPVVLQELDLGPCTELWTPDYLEEKLGSDRPVVVHSCDTDRMTFQTKNFSYVKKQFGDFIRGVAQGEKSYLRALSASNPAKHPTRIENDFPEIASDFRLPEILSPAMEKIHSSPLRISGPVTLWLHYDVLANVLCQVRGNKNLLLFPPSDVLHLDFSPGGSSSNIDAFTADEAFLKHTHSQEASLRPGEVLFIPPMWAHTASPTDGMSVAVNVFFRNLEHGYAAGRDVYGNRDLQAYENGRRDVDRIVKAFHNIPTDIGKFYLQRLAAELKSKADAIDS